MVAPRFAHVGDDLVQNPVGIDTNLFAEGIAPAREDKRWGYIAESGEWAIEPRFRAAYLFESGVAVVTLENGRNACVNRTGDILFESEGITCRIREGLVASSADGRYGFLNMKGEWAILPRFKDVGCFAEGLTCAIAPGSEKWGYIDTKGDWFLAPTYDEASPFSQGLALVGKRYDGKMKYGYVNIQGRWVVEPRYTWAGKYSDGRAAVSRGVRNSQSYRMGFLDPFGNEIIPMRFRNVAGGRFSSSLAGVRTLDGYEGYLDRWGHWALPPKRIGSRNVFPFVGSLAQTFLHGPNPKRYALINKLGEDVYEWQWQGDDLRKLCPSGKRV